MPDGPRQFSTGCKSRQRNGERSDSRGGEPRHDPGDTVRIENADSAPLSHAFSEQRSGESCTPAICLSKSESIARSDHEYVVSASLTSREQVRHGGRHPLELRGELRRSGRRHEAPTPSEWIVASPSASGFSQTRKAAVPLATMASSIPSSQSVKRVSTLPPGPLQASARAKKGPFRPGATKWTSQSSTWVSVPLCGPCSSSPSLRL